MARKSEKKLEDLLSETQKQDIINDYANMVPTADIAIKNDISTSSVNNFLRRRGIETRRLGLEVDEYAFSTITPDSAYWIGFLMADGNVRSSGQKEISLSLAVKDKAHVEKFKKFLKSDHRIALANTKKHPQARIAITSNIIVQDLAKFGVVPQKSFITQVKQLDFDPHFWRGAIDGDGSVFPPDINFPNGRIELNGSIYLIRQFETFVMSLCPNCKANMLPYRNIYRFILEGTHARTIVEALYTCGGPVLDRKYEASKIFLAAPPPGPDGYQKGQIAPNKGRKGVYNPITDTYKMVTKEELPQALIDGFIPGTGGKFRENRRLIFEAKQSNQTTLSVKYEA